MRDSRLGVRQLSRDRNLELTLSNYLLAYHQPPNFYMQAAPSSVGLSICRQKLI